MLCTCTAAVTDAVQDTKMRTAKNASRPFTIHLDRLTLSWGRVKSLTLENAHAR